MNVLDVMVTIGVIGLLLLCTNNYFILFKSRDKIIDKYKVSGLYEKMWIFFVIFELIFILLALTNIVEESIFGEFRNIIMLIFVSTQYFMCRNIYICENSIFCVGRLYKYEEIQRIELYPIAEIKNRDTINVVTNSAVIKLKLNVEDRSEIEKILFNKVPAKVRFK